MCLPSTSVVRRCTESRSRRSGRGPNLCSCRFRRSRSGCLDKHNCHSGMTCHLCIPRPMGHSRRRRAARTCPQGCSCRSADPVARNLDPRPRNHNCSRRPCRSSSSHNSTSGECIGLAGTPVRCRRRGRRHRSCSRHSSRKRRLRCTRSIHPSGTGSWCPRNTGRAGRLCRTHRSSAGYSGARCTAVHSRPRNIENPSRRRVALHRRQNPRLRRCPAHRCSTCTSHSGTTHWRHRRCRKPRSSGCRWRCPRSCRCTRHGLSRERCIAGTSRLRTRVGSAHKRRRSHRNSRGRSTRRRTSLRNQSPGHEWWNHMRRRLTGTACHPRMRCRSRHSFACRSKDWRIVVHLHPGSTERPSHTLFRCPHRHRRRRPVLLVRTVLPRRRHLHTWPLSRMHCRNHRSSGCRSECSRRYCRTRRMPVPSRRTNGRTRRYRRAGSAHKRCRSHRNSRGRCTR